MLTRAQARADIYHCCARLDLTVLALGVEAAAARCVQAYSPAVAFLTAADYGDAYTPPSTLDDSDAHYDGPSARQAERFNLHCWCDD